MCCLYSLRTLWVCKIIEEQQKRSPAVMAAGLWSVKALLFARACQRVRLPVKAARLVGSFRATHPADTSTNLSRFRFSLPSA